MRNIDTLDTIGKRFEIVSPFQLTEQIVHDTFFFPRAAEDICIEEFIEQYFEFFAKFIDVFDRFCYSETSCFDVLFQIVDYLRMFHTLLIFSFHHFCFSFSSFFCFNSIFNFGVACSCISEHIYIAIFRLKKRNNFVDRAICC